MLTKLDVLKIFGLKFWVFIKDSTCLYFEVNYTKHILVISK